MEKMTPEAAEQAATVIEKMFADLGELREHDPHLNLGHRTNVTEARVLLLELLSAATNGELKSVDDEFNPERSAATTLDDIREGGQRVLGMVLARLADAAEALRAGQFIRGARLLSEAMNKADVLATAEGGLGDWTGLMVVRAEELEEGNVTFNGRVIENIDRRELEQVGRSDQPHVHLYVKFQDSDDVVAFHGDNEVTIKIPESA